MKSFFVALGIFALLILLIVCNFFFVNATAEELIKQLTALRAENAEDKLPVLCAYWEQRRTLMSFSVPNAEIRSFQDRLSALSCANRFIDPAEFACARALALEAAQDLCRLERFSAGNLL